MTAEYHDRQDLEFFAWSEFASVFFELNSVVFGPSRVSRQLKGEVFTVASLAAGCRHCQAHGAYGLHLDGVDDDRIQALWDFERSDLFSEADRVALRFALDAGQVPNAVGPQHFAELRKHYSDREIAELLAVVGMSGFLNRYNDTLAVVTDQESVDWAQATLSQVGWDLGKHTGAAEEQRPMHPATFERLLRGDS
jgi:alkylhydroperoxidase family enzyme